MMKQFRITLTLALTCLALMLTACSGEGDSSVDPADASTAFDDISEPDLVNGRFVEVEAHDDGNRSLIATELEKEQAVDRIIQGPLDENAIQSYPGSQDGSLKNQGIAF